MTAAAPPPSFAVGDRVVLQGLQSAAHLNGCHGCISRELQQGRYAVDIDVNSQRRAIKPINLLREEPDNDDDDMMVADAIEGILPENHGRAVSYLLDLMRVNAACHFLSDQEVNSQMDLERLRSSPHGLLKIAHLTALGWSNWTTEGDDGLDVGTGDLPMGTFAMMKFGVEQVMEDFEENGVTESDAAPVVFAKDALQSPHAAGGWYVRVHGNFWIVGSSPETGAAYLIPEDNKSMLYEVLGIRNALYPMVARGPFTRPVLMAATLIPWYGRLLYDGVVMPAHGSNMPQQASHALAEKLQAAVDEAVNGGRVISRLRDMQRVLSEDPAATSSRLVPNRDPPSEEEGRYMEQLAALPAPVQASMQDHFDEVKPWMWTFRRMGYTEEENPSHMGMVIRASGGLLGPFDCSALAPTSVDILRNAVTYARQLNRQPRVLSIDERVCCDRLKFLLRDTNFSVHYYRPPSKEETEAALAFGGM